MIWGFGLVGLILVALMLGVPFMDFLAPETAIAMYDPTNNKWEIVALGSKTLWYNWQSWGYIGLFAITLAVICGIVFAITQVWADEKRIKKQLELDEAIREYQRSQATFERDTRQNIEASLEHTRKSLAQWRSETIKKENHAQALRDHAKQINKSTNLNHDRQNRENRSKLAQRDRLREQKRLLAEYLPHSGWKYADGSTPTYADLLREAQNFEKKNRLKGIPRKTKQP